MSKLELNFVKGQVLKAEQLNMMVETINENTQKIENHDWDVDVSESEFERLQASGRLDPNKTYYIYEE